MTKEKNTLTGIVVGKPDSKTAKVLVETSSFYSKYKKIFVKRRKYLVHDEKNVQVGDQVVIVSTRPISKRKNFKILKTIK